jgi:class 3 adenylate cyclase/tetratricopeptide (TPR) repeat protein
MQADDNPLALDLAITLATGDLWLPIMGDAQQKIIGFGGPAARTAVSMQNQAAPTEILIDASVQAALGDMLTLRAGAQGGQALVEVQSEFAKPGPDDSPIAELEAVEDLEQAISLLEAFVIPPLSQRLRYMPDNWRTASELRHVVAVVCCVRGLAHGTADVVRTLSKCFIAGHREFGGLIIGVEATADGHQIQTLYGLHSPCENDAERAVMASMRITQWIIAAAKKLNAKVSVHTVVHEGEIYFGAFGSEHRFSMTVLGAPIQLTEDLIGRPAPGQILVTSPVASKLSTNFSSDPQTDSIVVDGADMSLHSITEMTYGAARYMQARDANRDVAGRGTTLRDLEALVDDAIDSKGGIYALEGEQGTGKTFLLAPIVDRWVAAGGLGVIGHCRYSTESIPLAPITSMLFNLAGVSPATLDKDSKEGLREILKPYCQANYIDDLLDLLFARADEAQGLPAEVDDKWERILLAIEEIVSVRIKQQPILYVLEDLQHADSMTLRLAQRLATISRNRSFMVVCTFRPCERLHDIRDLIDQEFALTNLGLRELRDAVAAFFSAPKVDESVAILLWERTKGNPGQLYELMGFLRDRGMLVTDTQEVRRAEHSEAAFAELVPPSMSQQALIRVNQLGPLERHVLHCCAIVGQVIPQAVLRDFQFNDWEGLVLPAIARLLDHGILAPELSTTPSYRFRDDNARMAAYAAIPEHARKKLHATVADIIERIFAGDHDRNAVTLARHRELAGQYMMAIHWLERASRSSAAAMLDPQTVELVTRWYALVDRLRDEEKPPLTTYSQMAVRRFVATARHFGAEDALDQARVIADEYRSVMNQHEKAVCDLWHGAALQSLGQSQSAKARLSRAYESDTYAAVRCDAAIRMSKCLASDKEGAVRWLARAARLVADPDSYWADRVDLARACQAVDDGRLDHARILNAQVRDRAHRAGRIRLAAIATSNLADCDLLCGDVEDARRGFAEARVMSRCLGTRSDAAIDELNLGVAELYAGNADAASTHLGNAVAIASEIGYKAVEVEARVHLGAATAMLGKLEEGQRLCQEAQDLATDASLDFLEPVANLHLLHIAILREDKTEAMGLLRRCQKADPETLSPLLRDRLSMLRALGRPLLRN